MKKIFYELNVIERLTCLLGFVSLIIFCTNKWLIKIYVVELLDISFQVYVLISILILSNTKKD